MIPQDNLPILRHRGGQTSIAGACLPAQYSYITNGIKETEKASALFGFRSLFLGILRFALRSPYLISCVLLLITELADELVSVQLNDQLLVIL